MNTMDSLERLKVVAGSRSLVQYLRWRADGRRVRRRKLVAVAAIPKNPVTVTTSWHRVQVGRCTGLQRQPVCGLVGKILDDLPINNAIPCWDVSSNTRGLLDPGVFYLGYAEHGGPWAFFDAEGRVPSKYWLIDPRTGEVLKSGDRPPNRVPIELDRYEPSLLICTETTPAWARHQKSAGSS